ncbi:MAG TPA: AMIN domain-containing protein, partial [Thermoanaerobaculia bacterium]|nr:AMIN domain-containing protein [Thermoanaerobaculia bacterium]
MRKAKQILLVASLLAMTVSGADAGLWRRKAPQPADPPVAANAMRLSGVDIDGTRVLLRTSGAPAYTSYSPSPNVFVVDLTGTSRPAELSLPANLPPSIASIAAEEVVEMGARLTRVTFRLTEPLALEVSAEEKSVVVALPASAVAAAALPPVYEVPPAAAVAEAPPIETVNETPAPTVEAIAEPVAEPLSEPVAAPAPPSLAKAKSVRNITADGADIRISGDGALTYKAFRLESPSRLVVDLAGVNNAVARKSIDVNDAVVKRVRVAQFKAAPDPVTRVVIDLTAKSEYTIAADGDSVHVSFGNTSAPKKIEIVEAPAPTPQAPEAKVAIYEPPAPQPKPVAAVPADLPSQVPVIAENAPTWKMPEPASRGAKKVINAPADQNPPESAPRRVTVGGTGEDVFAT